MSHEFIFTISVQYRHAVVARLSKAVTDPLEAVSSLGTEAPQNRERQASQTDAVQCVEVGTARRSADHQGDHHETRPAMNIDRASPSETLASLASSHRLTMSPHKTDVHRK